MKATVIQCPVLSDACNTSQIPIRLSFYGPKLAHCASLTATFLDVSKESLFNFFGFENEMLSNWKFQWAIETLESSTLTGIVLKRLILNLEN